MFVIFYWVCFGQTFLDCLMWQMLLSHLVYNHWMLFVDVIAIVADVKATVFVYLWKTTYLMYCLVVADVIATLLIGWCNCHSGGWNYHICMGWCFTQYNSWNSHICDSNLISWIVADGMATFVTGWCCCHGGRCYGHWLECVRQML